MKTRLLTTIVIAFVIFLAVGSTVTYAKPEFTREIVVFDDSVKQEAQDALVSKHGSVVKHLQLINGVVALVPPKGRVGLVKEKGILNVEDDEKVFASASQALLLASTQVVPWGISKINADVAWPLAGSNTVKIGIVDSGIQLNHPDLASNVKGSFNAIDRKESANDDNGHGTHVAGIIASTDNDLGVVGVAPRAELYAVKVLDNTGSGRISDVIDGIQWCVSNHMQVANMSLGTVKYSKALYSAIKKAYSSGLIMVAAAGNGGPGTSTVEYPAKFNEVIAVSATDENNAITIWSSRGSEIDIAAPGNNIYSTFVNSTYGTLSGTSMAAPHVTGAIALKLSSSPGLTPTSILNLLRSTATGLPNASPEEQGAGLVDALKLLNSQ